MKTILYFALCLGPVVGILLAAAIQTQAEPAPPQPEPNLGLQSPATQLPQFPHHKLHLQNAGCSNPSYQPSPEEQAFIDAIHHVGSISTDDWIEFTDASHGQWTTDFLQDWMTCRITQAFTIEPQPHSFHLAFAAGVSQVTNPGTNPNASMTCSAAHDAGEDYDRIDVTTDTLDLVSIAADKCGEFHFHFTVAQ